MPSGPLKGVRVVDLTAMVMGPYCTQIMADMGADVVKVEPPQGDNTRYISVGPAPGMSGVFVNVNRGKRSIVLDLQTDAGTRALRALVETADVFIHSMRAKAIAKLGFAYEDVAASNPAIIYTGVFGYGQDGPYAARPAYDDLIQGACGVPTLLAKAGDGSPRYVPLTIADRIVGLFAVNAILAALRHRDVTGRGQRIDVPMFETMANFVLIDHLGGLTFDPPLDHGGYARLLAPERRPYRTKDGYLCALIYNDKQWRSFFHAIGRPDMQDDRFRDHASRIRHIREIYAAIADIFVTRTTAEWMRVLEEADIPYTPLRTIDDLVADPHLGAIGFFTEVEHPTEGKIKSMRTPSTWSDSKTESPRPAPTLGEHSREILEELGLVEQSIEDLFAKGIVRGPQAAAPAPANSDLV